MIKQISYAGLSVTSGTSEIQDIEIISIGSDQPFVLQYDGVTTSMFSYLTISINRSIM